MLDWAIMIETEPVSKVSFEFSAIGTSWKITIQGEAVGQDSPESKSNNLLQLKTEILDLISEFDLAYSRFKPDSLITRIAKESLNPGIKTYTLPKHSEALFALYQKLFEVSNGLFTACVGHTLEQTGYDATYSLKPQKSITRPPSFEIVTFVPAASSASDDLPVLQIPQCNSPLVLDFGAAGKGYLVDLVGTIIQKHFPDATWFINAGGDILHHAPHSNQQANSIIIGLENPLDTKQILGTVKLLNKSICGSAGNRRKWNNYHHIINPETLTSPEHILATWVVADTGLVTDGLATALYFVTPEILQTKFDFEYVILYTDGTVQHSQKFPGELFT